MAVPHGLLYAGYIKTAARFVGLRAYTVDNNHACRTEDIPLRRDCRLRARNARRFDNVRVSAAPLAAHMHPLRQRLTAGSRLLFPADRYRAGSDNKDVSMNEC